MAERFRVMIMPAAARGIAEICTFIERTSLQNSVTVAKRLIDAIDGLELLPERYKVHQHRKNPRLTVRSMPVPPFVVYYRVDVQSQVVRVLSVRHGARRPQRRFD